MVKKKFNWDNYILPEHSKKKHLILQKYLFEYVKVRCRFPQQQKFRLAIVDGFAGAGRYNCGSAGSPIIQMQELFNAASAVNTERKTQSFSPISFEYLFLFNDLDSAAIRLLRKHVEDLKDQMGATVDSVHFDVRYFDQDFGSVYSIIKHQIELTGIQNVIFNLDQYGDRKIDLDVMRDIMSSFKAPEIFLTFVISSLLAFLQKENPQKLLSRLSHLEVRGDSVEFLEQIVHKDTWLGAAEKIVFDAFSDIGPFRSPFSIVNPDGWRYWLLHFSKSYRARQVYNDILHEVASSQAHFGKSGLRMLSYDPRQEGDLLYRFDRSGRSRALQELPADIARFLSEIGQPMSVKSFFENTYNETPAHSDDINLAIQSNPDIVVRTSGGGERRKANTINPDDTIELKSQTSFYFFQGFSKGSF